MVVKGWGRGTRVVVSKYKASVLNDEEFLRLRSQPYVNRFNTTEPYVYNA